MTRLRHVSVNQVEDREAPASISTRISFSIPRIESANLRMDKRRRDISLEGRRSAQPKLDRFVRPLSQTSNSCLGNNRQPSRAHEEPRTFCCVTAVILAFLSRRAPFQTPLRVPGASVTLVIVPITHEVCVTSSYGTATLSHLSGAACFIYCCSFQP